jgi:hypothetical protein
VRGGDLPALGEHDLLVAAERLVAVLAQGDRPVAQLEIPDLLRLAEERLGKPHKANPPI